MIPLEFANVLAAGLAKTLPSVTLLNWFVRFWVFGYSVGCVDVWAWDTLFCTAGA